MLGNDHARRDAFYARLGQRIRLARLHRGMTQDALADAIRLTRTSITNIEGGRQKLLLHTFVSLAEALGCHPAELVDPPGAVQPESVGAHAHEAVPPHSTERDQMFGAAGPDCDAV
jgi:transcriptional regulator with XRE-family HTH domain